MKNTDNPTQSSEAKINANRQNAQKSTGPRSAEGKTASSRNGLKHGLCADKHILPGENPEDFLALLQDHLDRFQPVGAGEEALVLRIAADQWRLDRAFPMEAGIYRDHFHQVAEIDKFRQRQYAHEKEYAEKDGQPIPPPPTPPDEGDLLARAYNVDCAGPNSLSKLGRYENAIERSIDRCLRQLKVFQAARSTPVPEAPEPSEPPEPPEAPKVGPAAPPAAAPNSPRYEANPNNEAAAQPRTTPTPFRMVPDPTNMNPS